MAEAAGTYPGRWSAARQCAMAACAALGLAACLGGSRPGSAKKRLELRPCKVVDVAEPLRCGELVVPEDRARARGRTISLRVVVLPATGSRILPPLYSLDGGPGMPATAAAGFFATAGAIHREHADVILVDQRGTGGSGALPCPVSFSDPLRPVLELDVVRECRERLSTRANLASYSTAAAVADLEAVRAALGHDRIDLIGLSYGTRLAQEYLRTHPHRVRAVALLGTVSPTDKLPLPFARNAHDVLVRLAQQCAADIECHRVVPDMMADIAALRARLATERIQVALAGDRVATLEAGPFWEAVRAHLVTTSSQRRLPWLLHEAALGRFAPMLAASGADPGPDLAANGLLLSVSCPEDTLHIAGPEVSAADHTVFGAYRVRQQLTACKAWGLPVVPRAGFVASEAPVLLIAGGMDHVTPVRAAEEVAAHLPNSRVVVVPALGHLPEGLSNMECYERIVHAFFIAGDAADLDLECLNTMHPPPFQTDAR